MSLLCKLLIRVRDVSYHRSKWKKLRDFDGSFLKEYPKVIRCLVWDLQNLLEEWSFLNLYYALPNFG